MAHDYKAAVGIRLSREPAFELGAVMVADWPELGIVG